MFTTFKTQNSIGTLRDGVDSTGGDNRITRPIGNAYKPNGQYNHAANFIILVYIFGRPQRELWVN